MAKRIMMVVGIDGQIELLTDRVVIHRKGLWNVIRFGLNSHREIPLGAIAEVMFRDAGALVFGRIEFIRAGRSADEKKKDYSAVKFNRKSQRQFEILKEKIFELVDQYSKQKHQ